jgi:hypothetical protein
VRHALHFRVGQSISGLRSAASAKAVRVVAPEQHAVQRPAVQRPVVEGERRHAEHACRDRRLGIRAQLRLAGFALVRAASMPRAAATGANASMLSPASPSCQIQSNTRVDRRHRAARGDAQPQRASGLNGCAGGKRNTTPSCRACHSTWR